MVHPLLDAGLLPNFERLVNQGVVGKIASLQPAVSPLVWNSIATGVRPSRHGVLGYLHPSASGAVPSGGWHRKAAPFWEVCSDAGLRTHVVNWPTYPAEPITGTFVSEVFTRFGEGEDSAYRSLPRALFPRELNTGLAPALNPALASLRIDPRLLGHEELLPFVPHAAQVDQDRDPALAILASRLADAASAHAMATAVLEDDWQVAAVCYDLLDRLGHSFMRFHPPRMSVSSRSFDLYRGVMDQAYQFCDQMLGRLVELAGPQTTVIVFSDHGFRTANQRPPKASKGRADESWLRPSGILAISGPTTHRDRWVWGGSLLDLCPTLYSLFGLPWEGLDGKPLGDAFASKPVANDALSSQPKRPALDLPDKNEVTVLGRHLHEDGYLLEADLLETDVVGDQATVVAANACDYHAAQSCLQFGQVPEALKLFEDCLRRRPESPRFSVAVSSCYLALGQAAKARSLIEQTLEGIPEWYGALLLGQVLLAEGKLEEALEHFFRSESQEPRQAKIHVQIGDVYLQLEQVNEARRAFRKELDRNEDSAKAHFGLGKIALADGDLEEALERLLHSASLQEVHPEVHFCLAKTLQKLGRREDALQAIERALRQNPKLAEAAALRKALLSLGQ